ncbi:ATP-dependent permease [Cryptotrichosporon argae]
MDGSPSRPSASPSGASRLATSTPTPTFFRPPSSHTPASPDNRYPPHLSPRRAPSTPPNPPRARTPSTLQRAARTALPTSPAPSAWHGGREDLELDDAAAFARATSTRTPTPPPPGRPGRTLESPFHDSHSIVRVDGQASVLDDPFEYMAPPAPRPGRRSQAELFGPELPEVESRPVSEARRSMYPPATFIIPASTLEAHPDLAALPSPTSTEEVVAPAPTPVKPSFRRLFTLAPVRHRILYLLPAVVFSLLCGAVPPYMTLVIGSAFSAFEAYPLDTLTATAADKHTLMSSVSSTSLKLTVAGILALVFNYLKGVAWYRFSEVTTACLREIIFEGVQGKPMEWYDTGMGMGEDAVGKDSVGAGGLMARFTRESDEVRLATSLACGVTVQYIFSFLVCFGLSMYKQPVLAVVTLSSVPIIMVINIAAQVFGEPRYRVERRAFAEASTNVERATAAIATVKAHNAQAAEHARFARPIARARASLVRQAHMWAWVVGLSDFFLLAIFVVGFWYGAKVVNDGKTDVGNVMTVFWACLLASSFLQTAVPQLTVLSKGKTSLASLLTIVATPEPAVSSPRSPTFRNSAGDSLRKIRPQRCHGEFTLRNVMFSYPSRPSVRILRDVSLFLPAGEMTFIVGGSGSGKSTVTQLLLRLYPPATGDIFMDNHSLAYLDDAYTKEHIAAVQQGCILFDLSVHDNVAMGLAGAPGTRRPANVTRQEVVDACRMAYIHEFIESLPQGYETRLGTGGSQLSGGQKQRLAIARAHIRDPTVLILDEPTSALDATSRVVVFEAVKRWRANRTTIVITHDLSQIAPDDFVYVMAGGVVAEQGFRADLMRKGADGVFARMAHEQAAEPLAPTDDDELEETVNVEEILHADSAAPSPSPALGPHTRSFNAGLRPASDMYLDILDEYTRGDSADPRGSALAPARAQPTSVAQKRLGWSPIDLDKRYSARVADSPYRASMVSLHRPVSRSGATSRLSRCTTRQSVVSVRMEKDSDDLDELKIVVPEIEADAPSSPLPKQAPMPSIFATFAYWFPTVPNKHNLLLGMVGAIAHGAATPIWSSFVSKLMAIVGGSGSMSSITFYGGVSLGVCFAQAAADWMQEYFLYRVAAEWTAAVRVKAFERVLAQDKGWFDDSANSPARLVHALIKDAEDMRTLMSVIIGKAATFVTMVVLGLVWAMVIGWRLTLVGIAIGPVFAAIVMISERFTDLAEIRNKRAREAVAKTFYEAVANVRGIRAMTLERTFDELFASQVKHALETGQAGAWSTAVSSGATAAVPLFAQAMMNFVGAVFMEKNYLNYASMLEVYTLVLFSLTFGTQMLSFRKSMRVLLSPAQLQVRLGLTAVPLMAKARVASRDFDRVYGMKTSPSEAAGELRFPITGHIEFDRVCFAYPTRPDVAVLADFSLTLAPGECVAIVGPSGCGKSTVAALLQRLYEPTSGAIRVGGRFDLCSADVRWLRDHIAVVTQSANLFDASVADNVAYGAHVPLAEITRACAASNIHDFVQSLPQGYDTMLGENAALVSGGQAQRLQIARALVRRSAVLILDECTSALDVDNARAVLDTIARVKQTRTTVFITHSVEAMRRCDRVVCLDAGRVAEDGTFDELVRRGGVFAQLMKTGEWE